MAPPVPPEASKEIELVKGLVARYFPVYDVRVSYDVVQFFCRIDDATLEERFESMREEMAKQGYIPMISYDKGEHIVTVAKKPDAKYRSIYVNLTMLIITFVAMLIAGAINWASYADLPGDQIFGTEGLTFGLLYFTLPLMTILAVHELAHFAMARRRNVAASLPFFIPSIPPLGTFGAFISLRDPIPNRKSLLEIGVAGPIAGLLMTIPFALGGLYLTNLGAKPVPEDIGESGVVGIVFPLIFRGLEYLIPPAGDYLLHPMAFAAWVGFLVTALNLLPVGQLDGGHVARALLGARAKYLTWATIAALVGIGIFYFGWLLFALLILFLGARHPPPLNDISKLDAKRVFVGAIAFAILVIAFVPIPMVEIPADHSFTMEAASDTNATIAAGQSQLFQVVVNNTGNTRSQIQFSMASGPANWYTQFKRSDQNDSSYLQTYTTDLRVNHDATIDVLIHSAVATTVTNATVKIKAVAENSTAELEIEFGFNISSPAISYWIQNNNISVARGAYGNVTVQANNSGPALQNVTFVPYSGSSNIHVALFETWPNASTSLTVNISAGGNLTFGINIYVLSYATPGPMEIPVQVEYSGALIATITIQIQIT
jgi:Zn-dependent protease